VGKIVVCTMLSVDGYTEGPGGDVMAMPMDAAFAEHNTDRARTASSFLFGGPPNRGPRRTGLGSTATRTPHPWTTTSPGGTPRASPSPWSRTPWPQTTPGRAPPDDDRPACRPGAGRTTWCSATGWRIGAMSGRTGPRPARRALLVAQLNPESDEVKQFYA